MQLNGKKFCLLKGLIFLLAVVGRNICPVRELPGGPLCDELLCGMWVDVLESEGSVFHVRTFYGYEGWIDSTSLYFNNVLEWKTHSKSVIISAFADVLKYPDVQAEQIKLLPRGAIIIPDGNPYEGWQKIKLCDKSVGYVWNTFIRQWPFDQKQRDKKALRAALVQSALSYLGVQYRWGGKTPLGIDCSGLCSMAYLLQGVIIYRDARLMPGFALREIPADCAGAGDVLYFPGHMAMLIDEKGRYIHATAGNGCCHVTINSLDSRDPDYRADLKEKLTAAASIF